MTTHIMVDLETLGLVPGCVGFSIGAVEMFAPTSTGLGKEFYQVIDVDSALDCYLREDTETKKWWDGQSPEARTALDHARSGEAPPLKKVMADFNNWLQGCAPAKDILIYGNGADFDNPILRCMYDAAGVKPYAAPFGGRCYRTLKNLDELFGSAFSFEKLQRQGTYHNALDDAKSQALHLMENVARIRQIISGGGE